MPLREDLDYGRGRIGTCTATVSGKVEWLRDLHQWSGLKTVGGIKVAPELEGRIAAEIRMFTS